MSDKNYRIFVEFWDADGKMLGEEIRSVGPELEIHVPTQLPTNTVSIRMSVWHKLTNNGGE